VVDMGLPVLDGYELATHIRAQLGADAPVLIALSGYGQERDRLRSTAAGFQLHLVKPVDTDQLVDAIASLS
jgi:CheY-like chemotaxis protein